MTTSENQSIQKPPFTVKVIGIMRMSEVKPVLLFTLSPEYLAWMNGKVANDEKH